jgi:hypothetical protein
VAVKGRKIMGFFISIKYFLTSIKQQHYLLNLDPILLPPHNNSMHHRQFTIDNDRRQHDLFSQNTILKHDNNCTTLAASVSLGNIKLVLITPFDSWSEATANYSYCGYDLFGYIIGVVDLECRSSTTAAFPVTTSSTTPTFYNDDNADHKLRLSSSNSCAHPVCRFQAHFHQVVRAVAVYAVRREVA